MKEDVNSADMLGVIDTVFINSKPVLSYVPFLTVTSIFRGRTDRHIKEKNKVVRQGCSVSLITASAAPKVMSLIPRECLD